MIVKVEKYTAQCDRCGDVFFDDPYDDGKSLFETRSSLENMLKSYGWESIDGKLYCHECAKEMKKGGEK